MKKTLWATLSLLCILVPPVSAQTVKGTGASGEIPVWIGPHQLANSALVQSGENLGIGTTTPQAAFDVFSTSTQEFTIRGINTSTTGQGSGGYFQTDSSSGIALVAVSTTTTGQTPGIFAQTSCTSCGAIIGQQLAPTGFGGAVTGINASADGVGVVGRVTSTSGFGQGVFAETNSPNGIGALLRSRVPGGNILIGQVGIDAAAVNVFRVDTSGTGFFDGGTQVGGADFAESVAISKQETLQEPGDLLVVDTDGVRQLKLADQPYSTLVAGIYSTKPGVLASPKIANGMAANQIPLAIVGIVPCKVSAENGAILPGDLLVSSSTPGHAMKGTDRSRMLGSVVGKALEPLRSGKGVIEVLVTLQ